MKRFISGFLFGALLFAVPAIANNSKTVEAFYNNIKLSVYGQIVDTEGNEPFIVGGRTYVPARYVAEAMGGQVNWNAETDTVEVVRPGEPESMKMTSDGLKAIYNYSLKDYFLTLSQIRDKYCLAYDYNISSDYSILYYYKKTNRLDNVTVKTSYENGVIISYKEYENVLLPFFK